ncbi:hypothetical protein GMST_32810 [Geomonas silvestris]|uniref:Uncharacterized protein n=1 Tax=Geomonas silvestris TaxID=2740184 RepID=A0A6V8MLS8_9BACT|nr:hypothetical protein GMST_32810 [Geomonas silvestris]
MTAPSCQSPSAEFSSGYACQLLDEGHRKINLFLAADLVALAERQARRMNRIAGYLRVNFSPAALERGPISQ